MVIFPVARGQVIRLTDVVIENLTSSVPEGDSLRLQFRSPDPYNPIFQGEVARYAALHAKLFSTSPILPTRCFHIENTRRQTTFDIYVCTTPLS